MTEEKTKYYEDKIRFLEAELTKCRISKKPDPVIIPSAPSWQIPGGRVNTQIPAPVPEPIIQKPTPNPNIPPTGKFVKNNDTGEQQWVENTEHKEG